MKKSRGDLRTLVSSSVLLPSHQEGSSFLPFHCGEILLPQPPTPTPATGWATVNRTFVIQNKPSLFWSWFLKVFCYSRKPTNAFALMVMGQEYKCPMAYKIIFPMRNFPPSNVQSALLRNSKQTTQDLPKFLKVVSTVFFRTDPAGAGEMTQSLKMCTDLAENQKPVPPAPTSEGWHSPGTLDPGKSTPACMCTDLQVDTQYAHWVKWK